MAKINETLKIRFFMLLAMPCIDMWGVAAVECLKKVYYAYVCTIFLRPGFCAFKFHIKWKFQQSWSFLTLCLPAAALFQHQGYCNFVLSMLYLCVRTGGFLSQSVPSVLSHFLVIFLSWFRFLTNYRAKSQSIIVNSPIINQYCSAKGL